MHFAFRRVTLAIAVSVALASCTQSSPPSRNSATSTDTEKSDSASVATSTETTNATKPSTAFTDIKGISAESDINNLGTLGIIEEPAGDFKPFEPISRAEFVRWVVKANNVFAKDDAQTQIRLAETPEAAFVDVQPTHQDFKYIQGLANAGYVVGIDKTHFAPNRPITREELVMIKAQMDEGTELKTGQFDKRYVGYSDVDTINPDYIGAMYHDTCATTTRNASRIWGTMKTFQPKKAVTRSEAAICVSECRSGTAKNTIAAK